MSGDRQPILIQQRDVGAGSGTENVGRERTRQNPLGRFARAHRPTLDLNQLAALGLGGSLHEGGAPALPARAFFRSHRRPKGSMTRSWKGNGRRSPPTSAREVGDHSDNQQSTNWLQRSP